MRHEKIGRLQDERLVEGPYELHVPRTFEMDPRWGVIGLLMVATWRIFSGLSIPGVASEALAKARPPETSGTIKVPTGMPRARPPRAVPRAARPRSERARRRVPRAPPCRAAAGWQEPAGVGATARAFPTGDAGVQASYSTPTKSDGRLRTRYR
jgi:hypothetical protein